MLPTLTTTSCCVVSVLRQLFIALYITFISKYKEEKGARIMLLIFYVLTAVLSSVLSICFLSSALFPSRKAQLLRKFPGPCSLPIVGNALEISVMSNDFFFRVIQFTMVRYQGLSVSWIFNMPYLTVANVNVVQKILSSNTNIDKSGDYDLLNGWLGTGLLTSRGEKWFRHRKLLTPAFHFGILERFISIFNEQSQQLVSILKHEHADGKAFNIFPYVTRSALDIICEAAMGIKMNAQNERDSEYVRAIYRIGELIQYRQMRPWLHPQILWNILGWGGEEKKLLKILHGFTENVITQRKREMFGEHTRTLSGDDGGGRDNSGEILCKSKNLEEEGNGGREGGRAAFLDLLLKAQREGAASGDPSVQLSDQDIREETDTFMFEGHDTTAASINWTIFLLGCHPEYQALVHEELDSIFGDDKERKIGTEDLARMKYLECCIKESLRLYPSVPFIARAITSDIELDEETVIPTGTTAFIIPYQLHRDGNIFPEPEVFLPDRFFPENASRRNPFAYIPFSAGPRNCIGQKFALMEEKVVLGNLLRNFRIEAGERREDLVLLAELITRPRNGLHVKLQPR